MNSKIAKLRLRFNSLLLIGVALISACARVHPPQGRTTLSEPKTSYEVIKDASVTIPWDNGTTTGRVVLNSNMPTGNPDFDIPMHNAGYNGISELRWGTSSASPFVGNYAGLNLEHVLNGKASDDKKLQFEPRNHPMEIRKVSDSVYELYQAELPETGVESCTRFEFKKPHYIDVTFEFIPHKDNFPYGYLNFFWASYIQKPVDPAIYFLGRSKGDEIEKWIKGVTEKHGEKAVHRAATDRRDFKHDEPFPLTLVFNESDFVHTRPAYYGRYYSTTSASKTKPMVYMVMFNRNDNIRFVQSPSGGGDGCPAWDFQWFVEKPEVGKLYRMSYRAIYKPWDGQRDLIDENEKYRHGR